MHLTDQVVLAALAVVAIAGIAVAAYEWWTIVNDVPGDTISHRTQVWFKTKTRRGAFTFLACLTLVGLTGLAFLVWYSAHILSGFFV